jgi:hypothetical protein
MYDKDAATVWFLGERLRRGLYGRALFDEPGESDQFGGGNDAETERLLLDLLRDFILKCRDGRRRPAALELLQEPLARSPHAASRERAGCILAELAPPDEARRNASVDDLFD